MSSRAPWAAGSTRENMIEALVKATLEEEGKENALQVFENKIRKKRRKEKKAREKEEREIETKVALGGEGGRRQRRKEETPPRISSRDASTRVAEESAALLLRKSHVARYRA